MPKTTIDKPNRENFRFSKEHTKTLETLSRKLGKSKTEVVERALEELAEK